MDFSTIANAMYPYWILGVAVISLVIMAGQKHLLRIEKKPILNTIWFLGLIALWRFTLLKFFKFHGMVDVNNMSTIPPAVAFTVFWEDCCHGLPLLILKKLINPTKYMNLLYNLVTFLVMFEFGIGHLYEGLFAALLLGFYIPYSVKVGEKYGFGTIIICHILYDLSTMLFVQYFLNS